MPSNLPNGRIMVTFWHLKWKKNMCHYCSIFLRTSLFVSQTHFKIRVYGYQKVWALVGYWAVKYNLGEFYWVTFPSCETIDPCISDILAYIDRVWLKPYVITLLFTPKDKTSLAFGTWLPKRTFLVHKEVQNCLCTTRVQRPYKGN